MPPTPHLNRRSLLAGSAGIGLAAVGLAGCSTGTDTDGPGDGPGSTGAAQLPTYTPYGDAVPDLPGDPTTGVPACYFHYPEATRMPGIPLPQTDPFTYLAQANVTEPPKPGNPWYDRFVADMGNQFTLIAGGYAEYLEKFTVTVAGGDLPDLMMIEPVPQLPQLLESKFHDLTPYLGGDNVQEYPGLASLPTATWKVGSLAGKLWGVTRPSVSLSVTNVWSDETEALGLGADPAPADGSELIAMYKEMTGHDRFALGADPIMALLRPALEMTGAPKEWRVDDSGAFTHAYETEEYLHALEASAEMWAAEVMHPESITNPDAKSGWFSNGITRAFTHGFSAWGYTTVNHKGRRLGRIVLPKWDGGGPATLHRGSGGYYSFTAIAKSASKDRVRELLRIMDYIAAPFGTQAYLTGEYGVEGVHYELDGTDPVINSEPRSRDMIGGLGYAGRQSLFDIYIPGYDDVATRMHEYASQHMPTAVSDASEGLFSETWASKGSSYGPQIKDLQLAIIRGRKPLTAWTDFITKEWRPKVGDPARDEYQAAHQEVQ